jgi:hypothetical protein
VKKTVADGKTYDFVKSPAASKMDHFVLHPALYRQIGKLGGLNDLAKLLGVPLDWGARYDLLLTSYPLIRLHFSEFCRLSENTEEIVIENKFSMIAGLMGGLMGLNVEDGRGKEDCRRAFGAFAVRHLEQSELYDSREQHSCSRFGG